MPHPCVVCGRSRMNPNNREEDYAFFGFPVNYEERCKKWLEFCCREDLYKLTKKQLLQRMVCSKHFERKDFSNEYQDRLNCSGVPSIYDPTQSLYNIACVLCGRYRKDPPDSDYDGTTFHHFPGEEFRCLKWLDFVGIDSYYRLTRKEILYCYICSNHFERSQFVCGYKARLCDSAVPTIRHPDGGSRYESSRRQGKASNENAKVYHGATENKGSTEKTRKWEPLPSAVLESQACAACGRSRSDPRNKIERYKFHPFPAYEIGRCLRWCQFLGREDLLKMSPNQIRKLVLCSKHFLSGQSFHKVGPCDAVPTIRNATSEAIGATELTETRSAAFKMDRREEEEEEKNDEEYENRAMRSSLGRETAGPVVSSKKPKIDNKPAPLAKKRSRSKRPTCINIPKMDRSGGENARACKVPIPATNWKIQLANDQFQALAIANNASNVAITSDGKKVIFPFTGNISSLGAPIPVNSLSSMPPGFLIKINLPEQQRGVTKNIAEPPRVRTGRYGRNETELGDTTSPTKNVARRRRAARKNRDLVEEPPEIAPPSNEIDEDASGTNETGEGADDLGYDVIEMLEAEYMNTEDSFENTVVERDERIRDCDELVTGTDTQTTTNGEREDPPTDGIEVKKRSVRTTMSDRSRRTLLPIRTEVRHFLHKLKPYVRRLPRKAKAQIKLSIVNLIIDHL